MASLIVRQAFRAELTALAATLGVVFHDTVNNYEDIRDAEWITAEYYSDFVDDICMGGLRSKETGSVDVIISTKAGGTDNRALTLAGQILSHFRTWRNGEVEVNGFTPVGEMGSGDAESKYYSVSLSIEYNFRF